MSKYKFRNESDYTLIIPELSGVTLTQEYFTCKDGKVTIKKDYCWNGCTFAVDTKKTYNASLIHDSLYQYGNQLGMDRYVADRYFLRQLRKDGFEFSKAYYWGVIIFGWIFY